MNQIKSFTIYREIFKLINTLKPIAKRDQFIGKILDYYFNDIDPLFELDSDEEAIWENVSKPIIKYKNNALNGMKGGKPKNQNKTKLETERITQIETQNKTESITQTESTSNDVNVNVNSNCNCLNNNSNLDIIKKIIEYLNKKINSNFKYTTKTTQQKINARLNEGYVLDDFIAVIDKKHKEWIGTEFEKHLCPETLFGTKFEKYLNQKSTGKKKPNWIGKEIKPDLLTDDEVAEFEKELEAIK